ncbi:IS701 family transposase [Clostridium felsineum]|uniref:IS701 family transposase n=1 Tax=Clostridium felsineum TaxID=36839 RepID=UPI0020332EFA|nr:IS701 family transposase [Clostridium felsineum]URZ01374.1 IS701 family transposase ISCth16 [Clostridium felsineum]URZ01682.1 IS701 family transposase ISCth16 [Clostridium felsineum]
MPNKFTNHIVSINDELYNYLNDVNYGMNKPQFHHITTIINGLINLDGTKSLSKISENILTAKSSSSIYRFLSRSKWDDSLIDRNRINYLKLHFNKLIKPKSVGFLVIDDTVNPKIQSKKMQGLSYNHCHTEGKTLWSHCVVTSNFVAGDMSIPLNYKPYLSEENCKKHNKTFMGKSDIALNFINSFEKPSTCDKLYCLVDSWYTSENLINGSLLKGFNLIGALKSNRKISPLGTTMQIKEFAKYINPATLDVVTIEGTEYRVYRYEGKVSKFDNAIALICYEVDENSFKDPVYLMSTDVELSNETIIKYYLKRWSIETNYKYLKTHLGFDEYKVQGILSIERYFLLTFLAINFLEIYRLYHLKELQTIGDTIKSVKSLSAKELVCFVYEQAINNVSIELILDKLKLAS